MSQRQRALVSNHPSESKESPLLKETVNFSAKLPLALEMLTITPINADQTLFYGWNSVGIGYCFDLTTRQYSGIQKMRGRNSLTHLLLMQQNQIFALYNLRYQLVQYTSVLIDPHHTRLKPVRVFDLDLRIEQLTTPYFKVVKCNEDTILVLSVLSHFSAPYTNELVVNLVKVSADSSKQNRNFRCVLARDEIGLDDFYYAGQNQIIFVCLGKNKFRYYEMDYEAGRLKHLQDVASPDRISNIWVSPIPGHLIFAFHENSESYIDRSRIFHCVVKEGELIRKNYLGKMLNIHFGREQVSENGYFVFPDASHVSDISNRDDDIPIYSASVCLMTGMKKTHELMEPRGQLFLTKAEGRSRVVVYSCTQRKMFRLDENEYKHDVNFQDGLNAITDALPSQILKVHYPIVAQYAYDVRFFSRLNPVSCVELSEEFILADFQRRISEVTFKLKKMNSDAPEYPNYLQQQTILISAFQAITSNPDLQYADCYQLHLDEQTADLPDDLRSTCDFIQRVLSMTRTIKDRAVAKKTL